MRDGVKTARLVARDHPARPLEAAPDGDLSGAGGVEPGDGLVGAHEFGTLTPQLLELSLSELTAAGTGRGDHADGVRLRGVTAAEPGFVEGERRSGHTEVGETVRLDEEPLVDEARGIEAADLTADAERHVLASFAGDPVQGAEALPDGFPVRVGVQSVGRDHTDPGDGRAAGAFTAHRVLPPGSVRSTADWNPPNPLPTESTFRSFRGRAVRGT